MYRQIYRNKILYYLATQRFNSPKKPCKNPQFSDTPTLAGGVPTLLSEETPLFCRLPTPSFGDCHYSGVMGNIF